MMYEVVAWIMLGGIAAFLLVVLFDYLFPYLIVRGIEMSPTYKPGECFIACRFSRKKIDVGDVICYDSGCTYDFEIKRVKKIKVLVKNGGPVRYFFCEGDNAKDSYDSRHYGWVTEDSVLCRLPTRHQRTKNRMAVEA